MSDEPIATYTYDENGLRLTKTIGNTTHEFFYNDEVLDMEIVQENNTIKQYRSYEWNGNIPLGMIVKEKGEDGYFQTNAYQFITNHRGDVLSIRDAEDNEVASYQYDAYGNILSNEGKLAKENPIRYAGYYYDDETKNYYLQARYYNSENGAFLALDPHPGDDDEPLSQNGYTYANNNPIMNVDANGQSSKRILYALVTGLAFILYELTGTIKGVGTAIYTFFAYVKAYTDFQKAKKASKVELAEKLVKNSRAMKKHLINDAKKALRKKGIKLLAKASGLGWAVAIAVFTDGVYYGYSKKFYNDGLCKKWGRDAYAYATHVADKKA